MNAVVLAPIRLPGYGDQTFLCRKLPSLVIRRGHKFSTEKQIANERFLRRKIEPNPTLVNATLFSLAASSETIWKHERCRIRIDCKILKEKKCDQRNEYRISGDVMVVFRSARQRFGCKSYRQFVRT